MDDDGVGQLAEHVDISIVEVPAPYLPDFVLVVVLHDHGNAGDGLVLSHVYAAAGARVAFYQKACCAIFGRDCGGSGDGDKRDELENEPCQASGREKLHCV